MSTWRKVGYCLAMVAGLSFGAMAEEPGVPGLRQRSCSDWNNTTDGPDETDTVVPGALLAATSGGSYTYNDVTYTMGANQTWAYRGMMWMSGGVTYYCAGSYDDSVYLKITDPKTDTSKEVLKVSSKCAEASGNYTPAADGWYQIDVRVGNASGGVGPRGSVAGMDGAVVWNTNGLSKCQTADKQYWHVFLNSENDVYLYTDYPGKFTISDIPDQVYQGTPCEPTVEVYDYFSGTLLTRDVHYTLSFADNDRRGTATAMVTGIGEKYRGILIVKTFHVDAPEMSANVGDIVVEASDEPPYVSAVTVIDAKTNTPLVENTHYRLEYDNNSAFGVATVRVIGIGDFQYAETLVRTYHIGGILRAAPGGASDGDGRTWATAKSFDAALAALAQGGGEIWLKAGTYTDVSATAETAVAAPLRVIGGFAGDDAEPTALAADPMSVFDGGDARELIRIANAADAKVAFERVTFMRAKTRAFVKSGAGDLVISGCVFTANRTTTQRTHGRGLAVSGEGVAKVTLVDAAFNGNRCNTAGYNGAEWCGCGFGAFIDHCGRLTMDSCSFTTNGVVLGYKGLCHSGKFSGSALCVYSTPVTARGCRFAGNIAGISGGNDYGNSKNPVNNDGVTGKDGACVFLDGACGGSAFTNCVWVGNEEWSAQSQTTAASHGGAVSIYLSDTGDTVDFKNCTIAYNLSQAYKGPGGLNVVRGTVTVADSIIYGNVRGYPDTLVGADIDVKAAGRLAVRNSLLAGSGIPSVSYASEDVITLEPAVTTGIDPLFVSTVDDFGSLVVTASGNYRHFNTGASVYASLAALDVHPLSAGGYCLNGGAAGPAVSVTSIAVDGGDENADYSKEPTPNGERVNLGGYGNSPEASKTAVGQPSVAAFAVGSPAGDCRPTASVTLGLESGDDYLARVTLVIRAGDEVIASNDYNNAANGDVITLKAPTYLPAGTALAASVAITAKGAAKVADSANGTTTGTLPAFVGKGGGSGVIHVRSGADCRMNGQNWTDAYPDLASAFAAIDDTTREIWVSEGVYRLTASVAAAQPLAFRGGFAGTENAASARDLTRRSTVDNEDVYDMLTVENGEGVPVTVDGFVFRRARKQALVKTGAGDLAVSNCAFLANGANMCEIDGRGICADGATAGKLVIANCTFEGNRYMDAYDTPGHGGGAAVKDFAEATIDDCTFTTNGIRLGSANMASAGRAMGSALYVKNTRTTMRGCRFAGNVNAIYGTGGEGAATYFGGSCGGSAITNCAWVGNEDWRGNGDKNTAGSGALTIDLANAADQFSVCNVTIAYNLTETQYGAAGLNVLKGDVKLENSIVYGNFSGAVTPSVGADVNVRSGGSLEVRHTMFSATNAAEVTSAGALTYDEGTILLGDPLFVDSYLKVNDFVAHVASGYSYFKTDASTPAVLAGLDVHLKSSEGYRVNGGKDGPATDDNSPAIDRADPDASRDLEPAPNGDRRNLGAYGGTGEASKTPTVADFAVTTVPYCVYDGTAVTPAVTIALREGAAVLDPSLFTVEYAGNAGAGTGKATVRGNEGTAYAGQTASASFIVIPRIRVAAEVAEEGDGSDWEHPSSWAAAFARAKATGAELWLREGTYTDVSATDADVIPYPVEIRGGFAGTETVREDRALPRQKSVIDGANARELFKFANGAGVPVIFDSLKFFRGKSRAVDKTGSGNLEVIDCEFDQNGTGVKQIDGRGIHASGGSFAVLKVVNTTFTGHRSSSFSEWTGSGNAIYADQLSLMTLEGCVFERNGINLGVASSTYAGKSSGAAIYAFSTRVEAKGCRFAGNCAGLCGALDYLVGGDGVKGKDGATVFLDGACGGSEFRNCVWAGNCDWIAALTGANSGSAPKFGGAVTVNLAASAETVKFRYCTIAYNLSDGHYSPGGLNLVRGAVTVEDSLIYGNMRGYTEDYVGRDIAVKDEATLSIARSFVTSLEATCVSAASAENMTVEKASVRADNPLFVTAYDDIYALTATNSAGERYFPNAAGVLDALAAANVHLKGHKGYFDERTGAKVRGFRDVQSPAIDAGDKGADYSLEPAPNGHRVNLGAYGNTPWATMSVRGGALIVR